ncbi:MAG: outer membrane beta-barrel protein [Cellvibrionaceae bacterium]|nr:outer membrane beta-barrel protein [Cellvibrionaceae bacterium]
MFQLRQARIKGGGSVNYLWFGALFGLALAGRRRQAPHLAKEINVSCFADSEASPCAKGRALASARTKAAAFLLPLAATAALTLSPQQAEAETPNSYVEGSLGVVNSDWDMMTFYYDVAGSTQQASLAEKDDQRAGWQLLYGFRAHRNFALEVGYLDTGETELEVDVVVADTAALRQVLIDNVPVSGEGPYLGLRASYYADRDQELYLKAGLWSWSAGYTLSLGDQNEWVKADGTDWVLGLGFAIPVKERFSVGGSVQSAALGDGRLVMIGINLLYQFDVKR